MTVSLRSTLALMALLAMTACSGGVTPLSPSATTSITPAATASGSGGGGGGGGTGGSGGGGGGGTVTPGCVAQIASFDNVAGYGPYGPSVADIRTRVTVKNCTGSAVAWQARATYTGPFWGGQTFNFPISCDLSIAGGKSGTCQVTERYLLIQQTYHVTLDVLDASGAIIATTGADVATPAVPNPNAT